MSGASPQVGFEAIKVKTTASRTYVRYQQMYAGLKVFGAEVIVQVNASGGITAVISDIMRQSEEADLGKVSVNPRISALAAEEEAGQSLGETFEERILEASAATLMIYCPSVLGNTGPVRLVWQTVVSDIAGEAVREFVLVDAESGEIALHYSLIKHAMYREIWDCTSTCTVGREEGEGDTNDLEVDHAYDYVGDFYYFFYTEHERDSVDGEGCTLTAKVNYYYELQAEWSDYLQQATFGYGCVADDVVGHEFTHGVSDIGATGAAGAINESFSDMWGEWIDQHNGAGNDSNSVKWMIGEDWDWAYLVEHWPEMFPEDTVAIRYMKDPTLDGVDGVFQEGADCLSDYDADYSEFDPEYYNAGIGNKLAYLLTDGDTFNGYTISGMGISDAADLFYECMTNLLTSSVDYEDMGNALMLAAVNLGWSQGDRENVEKACRAVEIYTAGSGFYVKNSSGLPVAWFDDLGNLVLKGILTEETTPSPTAGDEFIFKDSQDELAIIDSSTGNMYIKGSHSSWTDPDSGMSEFIIRDDEGDAVAYIDEGGNLYLQGKLYHNGEPPIVKK